MTSTASLLLKVVLFSTIFHSGYSWNQEHISRPSCCDQTPPSRRAVLHTFLKSIPAVALFSKKEAAQASNLPASTGADTAKVGTVDSLIPIASLRYSLGRIQSELVRGEKIVIDKSIPNSEIEFKRKFDEYSDTVSYKQRFLDNNAFLVYYTKGFDGPGRANIEADINERQTQQFGLRNEAWIAFEAFLVELKFMDDDDNDAAKFLDKAVRALDSYLSLAPQEDVKAAQESLGVSW
jgi:hypothetical protein